MKRVRNRMGTGTETMGLIRCHKIPAKRKVVYYKNVCDLTPEKVETHRSRLVIRGNQIEYPDKAYTLTTDMAATKILLNFIISTKNGKAMGVDIKNYYLNTQMNRPEYIFIDMVDIPDEIVTQ